MNKNCGVTLIELILAITIIAVGVLPLLAGMAQVSEASIIQKDLMSAMTLGKLQMDSWLHRFQAIDGFPNSGSSYPTRIEKIFLPPTDKFLIHYNQAYWSTETEFTLMDGETEIRCAESDLNSAIKLSSLDKVVYHVCVKVWKIRNFDEPGDNGGAKLVFGSPGLEHGDELLYEVASLYSQTDRFNRF